MRADVTVIKQPFSGFFPVRVCGLGGFIQTAKLGLTQGLSFSRISESTSVGCLLPLAETPDIINGPPAFSVSSERHSQMRGERNCQSFEATVGGTYT